MIEDAKTVEEVAILELTFVAPLPKECRCYLCEQLMRSPCHLTCCNSRYCQKCVDRMISAKNTCKKCHSKWYCKETSSDDMAIKQIIDKLHVYCPMKINGCLWSGRMQDLETHLLWNEFKSNDTTACRFLPVPCPECGVSVPRWEMAEHLKGQCENRQVECQFCLHRDTASRIETLHQEACRVRLVECTNGCGIPGIKETHLTDHLLSECPLRYVSCDYKHIGCDQQFHCKDRIQHNEKYFQEHFYLMSEKVLVLGSENEELRSLALSVQHTCTKLQEQYSTMVSLLGGGGGSSQQTPGRKEDGAYLVVNQGDTITRQRVALPGSSSPPPILPRATLTKNAAGSMPPHPPSGPPILPRRTESMLEEAITFPLNDGNSEQQAPASTSVKRSYPKSVKPPRFSYLLRQSSADIVEPDKTPNVLPLPPKDVPIPDSHSPPPQHSAKESGTSGNRVLLPEDKGLADTFDLPPKGMESSGGPKDRALYDSPILKPKKTSDREALPGSQEDATYNSPPPRPKIMSRVLPSNKDAPYDIPTNRASQSDQEQAALYALPERRPSQTLPREQGQGAAYDSPPSRSERSSQLLPKDQGQDTVYDSPPMARARKVPPVPPERVHSSLYMPHPLKNRVLLPALVPKSRIKSVPNLIDNGQESVDTVSDDYQYRFRSWSNCEAPYVKMGSVSSINRYEMHKGSNRKLPPARDDLSDSADSQESIAEVFKSETRRIAQLPEQGLRSSDKEDDHYDRFRTNTNTINGAYVNVNLSNILNKTITHSPVQDIGNRDSVESFIEVLPNPVYKISCPPSMQSELEQKLLHRRILINQ